MHVNAVFSLNPPAPHSQGPTSRIQLAHDLRRQDFPWRTWENHGKIMGTSSTYMKASGWENHTKWNCLVV